MRIIETVAPGIENYASCELRRVLREHLGVQPGSLVPASGLPAGDDAIVIGTAGSNPSIAGLIRDGFLPAQQMPQGYSMRCAAHPALAGRWLLAIAGADPRGVLYALRDLEHYFMKHFRAEGGRVTATPFERTDYPRIEYRGHWVWGCHMPDKKAWLDNMSRWKLNELIHWDNYPPEKAKEYVDFAHERGIRVVWAFGWGWNPDYNFSLPPEFDYGVGQGVQMCGSSRFNREFFRREIMGKLRNLYAPTGCDGIYFQAFTECPKCECRECANRTMGQIMLDFVNPIVAAIKAEFPDLWISAGIHANFGEFSFLKDLDPRCNIMWENCDSGTSVRGEDEDFGYIAKKIYYGHGFSQTCPADPPYTEAWLQQWMASNAEQYAVQGGMEGRCAKMAEFQQWARNMTGKRSRNKHAHEVGDHSCFCRRTPFPHAALAEACWNPDLDTRATVRALSDFLKLDEQPAIVSPHRIAHQAEGKPIKLATNYSPVKEGGGPGALVNGWLAKTNDFSDSAWQGYEGVNLDATIDMGRVTRISMISCGFLHCTEKKAFVPDHLEFFASKDGVEFSAMSTFGRPFDFRDPRVDRAVFTMYVGVDARFVRVLAVNIGKVPDWHEAAGQAAWLLADEIIINPQ